ncbi:MAG: hypothetical protein Q7U10_11500 [Thermodesulfovibrionia bacterium]|nr:hypothetical protein [Thermodesulfovibrionia bacterium]
MRTNKSDNDSESALMIGYIIFGISIPIGLFIAINFGSRIEALREDSSFTAGIILWVLEWFFILIGLAIPWITWKKLVKPYK